MKRYRLKQDAWPGHLTERVRPGILVGVLVAGVALLAVLAGDAFLNARSLRSALPLMGVVIVFGVSLAFVRVHRAYWRTFEIVVDGERLVQRAAQARDLELARSDIVRVTEGPGGWLVVQAQDGRRMMVPKYVEELAELRSILDGWVNERAGGRTSG